MKNERVDKGIIAFGGKRYRFNRLVFVLLLTTLLASLMTGCEKSESTKLQEIYRTIRLVIDTAETAPHPYYRPGYEPITDIRWADVDEKALSSLDGLDYWKELPGMEYGQCTGYVSWVVVNHYKILDYPYAASTEDKRNGGEYVSAQRAWLLKNAYYVGSATTENGEITYHGDPYLPGDIIVFNCMADGNEGQLINMGLYDYWGNEETEYFTHIGIVGTDKTLWKETLDPEELVAEAERAGTLPEGQYNMHHNAESYGGICNILTPEQFITRDVEEEDYIFSRSYEVYRVLAP